MHVDASKVLKLFWGVKERRSLCSDGAGGRIVADILCFILVSSLKLRRVPIPSLYLCQKKAPLNDCRPVAFTPLVMKSFEKIVKDALLNTVQANLYPL